MPPAPPGARSAPRTLETTVLDTDPVRVEWRECVPALQGGAQLALRWCNYSSSLLQTSRPLAPPPSRSSRWRMLQRSLERLRAAPSPVHPTATGRGGRRSNQTACLLSSFGAAPSHAHPHAHAAVSEEAPSTQSAAHDSSCFGPNPIFAICSAAAAAAAATRASVAQLAGPRAHPLLPGTGNENL